MTRAEYVEPLVAVVDTETKSIINVLPQLFANGDVRHLGVIRIARGEIFAGHWHPAPNEQIMVLLEGVYLAASEEVGSDGKLILGTRQVKRINAGHVAFCPGHLAHAYAAIKDCLFLNLNTLPRAADRYGQHTIPINIAPPRLDEL